MINIPKYSLIKTIYIMDPVTILSHLIGPGSIKGGLKVANHIAGDGRFDGALH